ncbi:MAG TPA: hypothetical protein P5133_07415 [Spirochaetia bacterium]|nr:hypothetical protein [Spirochaetia bacterium]HRZ64738.1 hypothetical protein [Spirochaetia bacterium]
MAQGMIHRLIGVFIDAAEGLGISCECADVERLAVMIHRVMSYQSRQFHTLEHVFGFIEGPDHARKPGADHVTALAAAFHDLVYYQVDDGLPPELAGVLGPFLEREGDRTRLTSRAEPSRDPAYADCLAAFGFEPGQELKSSSGLNEFLSALAMAKTLERHLPREALVAVAACVEASIPFRGLDSSGRGVGEALESRLLSLSREGGLESSAEDIRSMVARAIAFANEDVKDFALPDPGLFLSNTWKLLPESNAALRHRGSFSIVEYRVALQKMRGFFRSLAPDRVYHSYDGRPDEGEMARLAEATKRNLDFAQTYMMAKLLAVALLEATAQVSGGDAPMALFMGDLPAEGESLESLSSFLPEIPVPAWLSTENPVYRLLKDGRLDESAFDLKNSPLALYLYHRLHPAAWGERARTAEDFFAGRLSPSAYLEGFEPAFLDEFLGACARMLPTRAGRIGAWLEGVKRA